MFAIGVGDALGNPDSAARLTAVSGAPTVPGARGGDFAKADYTLVKEFKELEEKLETARDGHVRALGEHHQVGPHARSSPGVHQ